MNNLTFSLPYISLEWTPYRGQPGGVRHSKMLFLFARHLPALDASKHSIPCLDIEIPATPNKALKDPHWRAAMVEEINFHQNWYLGLGSSPEEKNLIGRIKQKPDGSLERYRARLCAQGFDSFYDESFSDETNPLV